MRLMKTTAKDAVNAVIPAVPICAAAVKRKIIEKNNPTIDKYKSNIIV